MVKKVSFYYTHYQCLGHTTRVLSIVCFLSKLSKKKTKISLFQASLEQRYLKFPASIRKINLPFPLYGRENFRIPPSIDFEKINERAAFLLGKIKSINPDIFVTEYFPFGHCESEHELLPALKYLKENRRNLFCSLGYPFFQTRKLDKIKSLLNFYDKVFVHTPPGLELDYASKYINDKKVQKGYKDIFEKYAQKFRFTGYVLPFKINADRFIKKETGQGKDVFSGKKMVLVTRGAGAYYPKIITCAILAKKYLKDTVFLVIAGPSTTDAEWGIYSKLKDKYNPNNLILKRYVPNLPEYLKKADLVVSTAGYNTSAMLMYYGKKAVIVPFRGYPQYSGFWEQPVRARLLNDLLGSTTIDYYGLTPKLLSEAIDKQLNKKINIPSLNPSWFNGGEITAREILSA